MISHNCIGCLVKELQGNDILLQLNALELLSDLAAVPHGRTYIENQQLLHNLSPYLERGTDDLTVSLLLPGIKLNKLELVKLKFKTIQVNNLCFLCPDVDFIVFIFLWLLMLSKN